MKRRAGCMSKGRPHGSTAAAPAGSAARMTAAAPSSPGPRQPQKGERGKRKKGNHREEGRKRGDYRGVIVGRWVKGRVTSSRGERVLSPYSP